MLKRLKNLATVLLMGVPVWVGLAGLLREPPGTLFVRGVGAGDTVRVDGREFPAVVDVVGPLDLKPGGHQVRVEHGRVTLLAQRVELMPGRSSDVWARRASADDEPPPASSDAGADLGEGQRLAEAGAAAGVLGFSGDGRRALSGGADGKLRFWDLEGDRTPRTVAGHGGTIEGLATFDGGRRVLSAAGDNLLRVWDTETGGLVRALPLGEDAKACDATVTPDGRVAAVAFESGGVRVVDLGTGRLLLRLSVLPAAVGSLALSADGRTLLAGLIGPPDGTNAVEVRDVATGRVVRRLGGHDGPVWGVACLPDGRRAVSAAGRSLRVWDLTTGRTLNRFDTLPGSARCLTVSADGRHALVGTGHRWARGWECAERYGVHLWDLDEGRYVGRFDTRGPVRSVALSPDGRRVLTSGADRGVEVWEMPPSIVRSAVSAVASQPRIKPEADQTTPMPEEAGERPTGQWVPG